jgi:putative ABC transport system permease protein
MSGLRQIFAVVGMNLRNLPQRVGSSLVIVLGIAGVVAVLVSVLSMAVGFSRTISGAGSPDRALILSGGALAESLSNISADAIPNILNAPGIARDAAGHPIVSAEVVAQLQVAQPDSAGPANVAVRGVGSEQSLLRPEIHLVAGRMYRPGLHEVIVGRSVQAQHPGLAIGSHLSFQNGDWVVVGTFSSSQPNLLDSEVETDAQTLASALQRNWYNSVTVRLANPGAFEPLKSALTADPTLHVTALLESTYRATQSRALYAFLKVIAYFIGGMMAAGALFGALNSLYAAVSARGLEIATLRAIGFSSGSVVVSVLTEALLLSVVGALLGALCAWALFDGHVSSMMLGAQSAPISYAMEVTPALVALGIIWACVIGLIGGLFPAMRAARLPVARALNAVV